MSISVEVLRSHLAYSAWANKALVDAAGELAGEELTRDFGTADKSVLGTLVHIFAADRVWLARMRGEPQRFSSDADCRLSVLQNDWPALHEGWRAWASGLREGDADSILSYRDLRGNPWQQPLWCLVMHVVNHATHHRGQVSGFLRAMGRKPPVLDLVYYYRKVRPV